MAKIKVSFGGNTAQAYEVLAESIQEAGEVMVSGVCPNPECLVGKVINAKCVLSEGAATTTTCLRQAERHFGIGIDRR